MEKTKNTKNTLLGRLPARLGTLALAGLLLGMGGCGTITPQQITHYDKTGSGLVYAVVPPGAGRDPQFACDRFLAKNTKDDRCSNIKNYDAVWASMISNPMGGDGFPVLIPKDGKIRIEAQDIIKVQLVDNAPAVFVEIANKGSNGPNCFNHVIRNGGVTCPKYGWDYRDYVPGK